MNKSQYRIVCLLLVIVATVSLSIVAVDSSLNNESNISADKFRRKDREVSFGDTTREQVLETRERRKRQLKRMVLDARQKLSDHAAGEISLTTENKKALEDQMDILQRKLDTMKEEMEEWEIDRMVARESSRAQMRRERSAATRRVVNDEI